MPTPEPPVSAETLYLDALELPDSERAAFLERSCVGDAALRARVERLFELERGLPAGFLAGDTNARATRLEPGTSFAGFQVLGVLGEGGMGTVYAARQAFPRRDIALKVIRPDRVTPETLRRFQQEVQALGSLQHAGIAQVYDAGTARRTSTSEPEPYLAMELVRGAPIVAHAVEQGLGPRERMELVARVADAVQHAHQRGVIHRDLKPDNVLVTPDETASFRADSGDAKLGQPKVLDFGIARLLGDAGAVETRAGELMGTLSYMSPEQLAGHSEQVDERTDVYALGVLLYQLLAGRLPHDLAGLNTPEAVIALSRQRPRPLESVAPGFRGDVATIAARALDPDPDQRYASAAALAEDLRRHLRHEPIRARSHSTLYLLQRGLRRHRVGIGLAAGLAVVLIVFGLVLRTRSSELSAMAAQRDVEFQRTLDSLRLVADVADGLGQEWGPTRHQRQLLEAVLASHLVLLEQDAENEMALVRAARTRFEVSRIQAALGDDPAAREAAAQALEELRALQARGVDTLLMIPTVQLHLADVLTDLGDQEQAALEAGQARARFEAAGATASAVEATSRLAGIARARGDSAQALLLARSAVEGAERLDPGAGRTDLRISSLSELALATHRVEGPQAAIEVFERLADVLGGDGLDGGRQALVAEVRVNLGRLFFEAGRPEEAERALVQAVAVGEELVASYPEAETHARLLLAALNNLGALHGMRGQPEEAGACLERGLELVEGLLRTSPENQQLLLQRDFLLTNVGTHRASSDDLDSGCELLERALESWTTRHSADPHDPDARDTLVITVNELAEALIDAGDAEGAFEALVHFPPTSELNGVGRALSFYSLMIRDAGDDAGRYARAGGELLDRCAAAGFTDFQVLREAHHFASLRSDPGFAELLASY